MQVIFKNRKRLYHLIILVQKFNQCNSDTKHFFRIVYCEGPLLEAVNLHHIYNDSKEFVDRPLREKPKVVMDAFAKRFNVSDIKSIKPKDLNDFVEQYFYNATTELKVTIWANLNILLFQECVPVDWKPNPPKIMQIQDPKLRQWALDLHGIWKTLCRTINEDVKTNPDMHSM
jgi:alpha,alpha-trehalase